MERTPRKSDQEHAEVRSPNSMTNQVISLNILLVTQMGRNFASVFSTVARFEAYSLTASLGSRLRDSGSTCIVQLVLATDSGI